MRALALAVFVLPVAASAQPAPGTEAPPLAFAEALGAPAGDLAGRAVVVDFWATWCAPCIAAMPHLDSLVAEFAGEPVVFLAPTDEDAATVQGFLDRRPMSASVVLDAEAAVAGAYGVQFLPHTALVYADGRYAGFVSPRDVTPAVVRALISGDPLPIPTDDRPEVRTEAPPESVMRASAPGGLTLRIAYTDATSGGYRYYPDAGTMSAERIPVRNLIGIAYAVSPVRRVMPDSVGSRSVSAEVMLPGGLPESPPDAQPPGQAEAFRALLQHAVPVALGLRVRRETRPTEALVIRVAPGGPSAALRPSTQTDYRGGTAATALAATGATLADLAETLEYTLDTVVVDETGLTGRYDVTVPYADFDAAAEAIARELGLTVTRETVPVEMVVVDG